MKDSDGTENQQKRKALREIIKKTLEDQAQELLMELPREISMGQRAVLTRFWRV